MPTYVYSSRKRLSDSFGLLLLLLTLSLGLWSLWAYLADTLNLWIIPGWILFSLSGYFLFGLNNTFGIFSMGRTSQVSAFMMMVSSSPGLQTIGTAQIETLAEAIALFALFRSYEHKRSEVYLFRMFLLLSLSVVICPQFLLVVPAFLIGAFILNSLTMKNLMACLIGFILPLWFYQAYGAITGDWRIVYQLFMDAVNVQLILRTPTWAETVNLGLFLLFLVIALGYHFGTNSGSRHLRKFLRCLSMLSLLTMTLVIFVSSWRITLRPLMYLPLAMMMGYLIETVSTGNSNRIYQFYLSSILLISAVNLWISI